VLVPELPADPAGYAPFLEELDVFEVLELTAEDRRRGEMYAQQAARGRLRDASGSLDDYLRSLRIVLRVAPLSPETLPRACQMVMKTNQFNLTTRRHGEGRMAELLEDPAWEAYTLSVADAFDDSGTTGLALLNYRDQTCVIDTLLLSCRVLGRRVEETFLSVLAGAAARRAGKLVGEYVPTARNGQTAGFYPERGFRPLGREGEVERFELDLTAAGAPPRCELHELTLQGIET